MVYMFGSIKRSINFKSFLKVYYFGRLRLAATLKDKSSKYVQSLWRRSLEVSWREDERDLLRKIISGLLNLSLGTF